MKTGQYLSIVTDDRPLLRVQSVMAHAKLPSKFLKERKTSKIRFKQQIRIVKMFMICRFYFLNLSKKLIFVRESRLSISSLSKLQSDLARCYMGNAIVRLEMVTIIVMMLRN